MENKEIFKNYMSIFGEMFDKALSPALTSIYWESFKSYTDDQCEKAFKDAIVTCKFFPKPAEIIELIMSTNKGYKALEAWTEILLAIENRKQDKLGIMDPDIKDPKSILALYSLGGIEFILKAESKNMRWVRKDFIDTYNMINSAPEKDIKLLGCGENNPELPDISSMDQKRRYMQFKDYIDRNYYDYSYDKYKNKEMTEDEYNSLQGEKCDPDMIDYFFKGKIPDNELEEYKNRYINRAKIDEIWRLQEAEKLKKQIEERENNGN